MQQYLGLCLVSGESNLSQLNGYVTIYQVVWHCETVASKLSTLSYINNNKIKTKQEGKKEEENKILSRCLSQNNQNLKTYKITRNFGKF